MKPASSFLTWAVIALAAGAGCRPPPSEKWHAEGAYRWRELAVSRRGGGGGGPGFTSIQGSRSGISFVNEVTY